MRRCLACGKEFEDQRLVCPSDHEILVQEGRPALETGMVLHGRYRLGNLLGEGGMGKVFVGQRVDSGEEVALKLLKEVSGDDESDAQARRRFQVEAEAAAALRHPGVVKVLELDSTPEGQTYIAMERLRGATFDELRRAGKMAPLERVVELMVEVCAILEAAHAGGIVHRDLKPQNLFLHRPPQGAWQVKVLDFGIAKILDRAGERLTTTGEFLGTLLYMAPEQIAGQKISRACDIYSLGVILFEALAGKPPFAARGPLDLLRLHASEPIPSLCAFCPEVSEELELLVERCLMRRPESRFVHAGELRDALAGLKKVRTSATPREETRLVRSSPGQWVGVILEERYEIQEWMTPGRFGSDVYRALHLRTGASVAVRLWMTGKGELRDFLLSAYRKEARAMGVRHPNLIAILDLGFNERCVYMVTELLESVSLRSLLARRGALPEAEAVALARGAAEALGALHGHGIISGGLSPETLRVTMDREAPPRLLLTPFGLTSSRQLRSLLALAVRSESGDRSADYISPEQRDGAEPDARSDLFSLALILLEMLTGEPVDFQRTPSPLGAPSREPDTPATAPRVPPGLGLSWIEFFRRALAWRPQDRFASAEEFIAALPGDAGTHR